jgi:hypothetical protein
MTISKTQMEILKAAYAAGSKGLMWVPDRLGWFTRDGKRLRTPSVFSLAATGLLQIIRPGATVDGKGNDYSIHSFIAVLTGAAERLLTQQQSLGAR